MRKGFKHLLAVCAVLLTARSLPAATLMLTPSQQHTELGSAFTLVVNVASISVGSFDLTVSFNPFLIAATDVVFGQSLGSPLSVQSYSLGFSSVSFAETSFLDSIDLQSLQTASFRLATLSFRAIGTGTAAIDFSSSLVADPYATIIETSRQGAVVVIGTPPLTSVPELPSIAYCVAPLLVILILRMNSMNLGS